MKTAIAAATALTLSASTVFAGETITRDDVPEDTLGAGGTCMIYTSDLIVQDISSLQKCFDYVQSLSSATYGPVGRQITGPVKGIIDSESYDRPFSFYCFDTQCETIELP